MRRELLVRRGRRALRVSLGQRDQQERPELQEPPGQRERPGPPDLRVRTAWTVWTAHEALQGQQERRGQLGRPVRRGRPAQPALLGPRAQPGPPGQRELRGPRGRRGRLVQPERTDLTGSTVLEAQRESLAPERQDLPARPGLQEPQVRPDRQVLRVPQGQRGRQGQQDQRDRTAWTVWMELAAQRE